MATTPRDAGFDSTGEYRTRECSRKQPRNQVLTHTAVKPLRLSFRGILDLYGLRQSANFLGDLFNQREDCVIHVEGGPVAQRGKWAAWASRFSA
jgi:CelD/BcsL family acetyltransferase involved in cellulose biosynthesis